MEVVIAEKTLNVIAAPSTELRRITLTEINGDNDDILPCWQRNMAVIYRVLSYKAAYFLFSDSNDR